jgi:hypothetical protein
MAQSKLLILHRYLICPYPSFFRSSLPFVLVAVTAAVILALALAGFKE